MELKRQLLICNEAREELAQKAYQQQDLLFRQQQVLKEQHASLLQYQKLVHPDVKRYSVRELMELREASRSAPPVQDTSELPFAGALDNDAQVCWATAIVLLIYSSLKAQKSSSSSTQAKPPTPGQLQDSASSTAPRDASNPSSKSPERWSKGVAGKYAARYVQRGAAAATTTSS